jgi:ParB family chromosome partitioning protein
VRAAEKAAQASRRAPGSPRAGRGARPQDAAAVVGIERKLTSHLGARVAVLHTARRGRIVIEYRGNEDLQRLLEKLGVEA